MGNGGITLGNEGVQVLDHLVLKLVEFREEALLVFLLVELGVLELQLLLHSFNEFGLVK